MAQRKIKGKIFHIKFKKIKNLPSISGNVIIKGKSKKTAINKFKRGVFGRQKIIKVKEIKINGKK